VIKNIQLLYKFRELLWAWTLREIKVRYKQSFIGGLWAIIQPFSMMVMLTIVFSVFTRISTGGVPYPVFYYTALLPWVLFTSAISYAVPSLVSNMSLVTKIYFPREILPFSSIGAAFFDFCVASTIYILMMVVYRVHLYRVAMWLPLLLLIQIILILGIVLFLSALMVFYRDVRFVIPLLTQIWMYASPIIYPVSSVPEKYLSLYMLNPMASLIDGYRKIMLYGQPPEMEYIALSGVISLIGLFIGYKYFKKTEGIFADMI
jgi:lipopolysaccharide transport system permease protein